MERTKNDTEAKCEQRKRGDATKGGHRAGPRLSGNHPRGLALVDGDSQARRLP